MVQALINPFKIRQELTQFLRNKDILSISERGVTTATDTGTFSSDSTYLIDQPNVKNVRGVTRGSLLAYGTDYTIDFTYDDSGTTKAQITFTSAQTGSYSIEYDYGSDKIWPDFPRDDLNISSYPRIAIDVGGLITDVFGIGGNEFINEIPITATVFSQSTEEIDTLINLIRKNILENVSSFFYIRFVKPTGSGPLIENPGSRQEIMRKELTFLSMFNVEKVS